MTDTLSCAIMSQKPQQVKNLGPASWRMLQAAGISDEHTLRQVGAAAAYVAVESTQTHASLNLLYAMAAGLDGRHWCDLSHGEKGRLLREVEDLREIHPQKNPPAT